MYRYVTGDKRLQLPPGPVPLPVIGNLLSLGPDPREPLLDIRRKYGDVFTIYLGARRTIMLCSHEVIKEAFVKFSNVFTGRPQDLFFVEEIMKGRGKNNDKFPIHLIMLFCILL